MNLSPSNHDVLGPIASDTRAAVDALVIGAELAVPAEVAAKPDVIAADLGASVDQLLRWGY